jgi:hypothetical protein
MAGMIDFDEFHIRAMERPKQKSKQLSYRLF